MVSSTNKKIDYGKWQMSFDLSVVLIDKALTPSDYVFVTFSRLEMLEED